MKQQQRGVAMKEHDLYIVVFEDQQQMEACQAFLMDVGTYLILKSQPLTLIVDVEALDAFDVFREENNEEGYKYCYGMDFLEALQRDTVD